MTDYLRGGKMALLGLIILCSGCATITTGGGPDQKIRISSEPRGAAIFVDGQNRGTTPTSVQLTRKDDHTVRLELAGYEAYEKELHSGMNAMVFGNILIGGLIGTGVDLISGATSALNPGEVNATLVKTSASLSPYVNAAKSTSSAQPNSPMRPGSEMELTPNGIVIYKPLR